MPKLTAGPVLLLFAATAFGLAGCSSSEAGNPVPSAGVPSSSSDSGPASSTAPSSTGGSSSADTASIKPCSLLGVSDLAEYGTFTGPTERELGGARGCSFQKQLASASDKGLTVSIGIRDTQGISSVNDPGGGKEPTSVNGRDAVKAKGTRACLVALGVGDKARVDVSVTSDSTEEACAAADKFAGVVEPKLPKG
jgi:hypothetical protein